MPRIAALPTGLLVVALLSPPSRGAEGPKVPVALAWGPGDRLLVALRDAKRVATVDPKTWRAVDGRDVAFRPASLAVADDGATLLVGGMEGQAAAIDRDGRVVRDLPRGRGPTRLLPLPGGRALVASMWDGAVRLLDWRDGRVLAEHPFPFATGAMVRRPDGRVIVADAFGGRLADLEPGAVGSERAFSVAGVGLRDLAISGDGKELLTVHMAQYDEVPITESNIDGGRVLSGRLGAVRLSAIDGEARPGARLAMRQLELDGPRHGAADPSAMALSSDGSKVFIALSGAHQVLKDDRTQGLSPVGTGDLLPLGHNQRLEVVEVGRSPVAIALDPSGRFVVTADAMSDTLSVLDADNLSFVATVALGPRDPARTPAQRGEALFLDGRRAMDRWMSCSSCHKAGHTNGLNFDTQGDRGYGAPKNTPTLLGVGPTSPFTWTGEFERLADQVHQSLRTSLRGPEAEPGVVEDLSAFLESLPPPPPRRSADDPAALRGAEAFRARRCDSCHRPPLYTSTGTRDVGLDDGPGGHRRFNAPALRGISWTAPYLHDGRAATLADLLDAHSPGRKDAMDPRERDDLIAYLESL
jgi:mono/diheme cytochrome c family protein